MAITQNIGIIPEAGHRGIDAREAFVTKQEAFQDHLTDTFVTEINTLNTQINNEVATLNGNLATATNTAVANATLAASNSATSAGISASTATQKATEATASALSASGSATTATTKASEANTSANQALTYKNQVMGYVVPSGASYSVDQLNTKYSAVTKAQFNALAEERKANRAGSGFDSFGWGSIAAPSTDTIINEGMWVRSTIPDNIHLSRSDGGNQGISKSKVPIVNINGVQHKIFDNGGDRITLPTAPNIYPHDTVLTAEQIASGVIKHADASNSGLIVNGKFDTDTSGWTSAVTFPATLSSASGKLRVTANAPFGRAIQGFPTVIGKKYFIKGQKTLISGTGTAQINLSMWNGADRALNVDNIGEFTALDTTTYVVCALSGDASNGAVAEFDNIAVYPEDAISRSDLLFLESWHEDISEKNFVYPLGNVQYLGANTDGLTGIANGSFTGFETYSLFGNWQTSSALIGKGYVWSSLTEAQKRAFVSNPVNNCYLDGDKTIQVRYRVRVVQGAGDNWGYPVAIIDGGGSNPPGSTVYYSTPSFYIKPKGKLASISYDLTRDDAYETGFFASKNFKNITTGYGIGMTIAVNKNANSLDTGVAYEGKCFALPIALISR